MSKIISSDAQVYIVVIITILVNLPNCAKIICLFKIAFDKKCEHSVFGAFPFGFHDKVHVDFVNARYVIKLNFAMFLPVRKYGALLNRVFFRPWKWLRPATE